jgi:DNA-binding response OmpR family regulator
MERILVVNNDFDAMELLEKWLKRKSYKVKYTGNEDEVADIVKDFKPDLVLVDVLKEMAAKELKSSEKTKQIPILMMTGYTLKSQNYPKENVDDVIEKPFDPLELDKKIEKLLKRGG